MTTMQKRVLTIEEEQRIQYDILKIFNKLCSEKGIKYYLAYGTLLGAVRDKGFIQWDDDVDIWVYRNDLEIIKKYFYEYFDKNTYFYQDRFSDPKCMSPEMSRICVNDTYKWPDGNENENFHTGIYFDLFPLDNGYGDDRDIEYTKQFAKNHNLLTAQLKSKKSEHFKTKLIRKIIKLVPRRLITKYVMSIVDLYKDNPSSKHLVSFPASYAGTNRAVFKSELFESSIVLQFEDLQLPCPERYDELLRYMYGNDYMTPKVTKPSIIHGAVFIKQ